MTAETERDPLRKIVAALLAAVVLSGCTSPARSQEAERVPDRTMKTAKETEAPVIRRNFNTLKQTADAVAEKITSNQWEELSSLFQSDLREPDHASLLQEEMTAAAEGPYTVLETDPVVREDLYGGIVLLESASGTVEAVFTVNEALELNAFACGLRPGISAEPEEGEDWREMLITAGNAPALYGILTLPSETDDAPVAILMPEELDDPMNESGSNQTLRSELAHQLAEQGVASVRFDMRAAEDPVFTSVFGWRFAQTVSEDFAAIVHSLELYPVNASKIIYIGHGTAGALGYGLVNAHFEITGGLVLINAPYESDGVHLFARSIWLDEETTDLAAQRVENEDADTEETAGYPVSWWREWQNMGALRSTRFVAIPILIQQAEDDEIVSFKEDYENWKSQKGSNVTMKSYKEVGHDLRRKDGDFDERFAEDIADWIKGVDISKKKDPTETPAPSAAGKRT